MTPGNKFPLTEGKASRMVEIHYVEIEKASKNNM
jgi:hypothetical protein